MRTNPSSHRDEHCHLLKGLIHCEDCGSTMTPHPSGKTGKDGERFLYYACVSVVRELKRCRCRVRRLPVRKFEAAVIQLLGEIAGDDEVLLSLAEEPRHHVGRPFLAFIWKGTSTGPDSNYWRNNQHA